MTPQVTARTIGHEREPVATIENFVPDPEALRAAAAATAFSAAGFNYPGIRGEVPSSYLPLVGPLIGAVVREVFGVTEKLRILDLRFSIVTTPPAQLTVEQRLPHVDALEPGRLALVHYLGPGDEDGTGFYRHRATGFETIDAARGPRYFSSLHEDLRRHPAEAAYMAGDTALFERIARFEGRYNSAILYRGRALHSGDIGSGRILSPDPADGRLTITGFFAPALAA